MSNYLVTTNLGNLWYISNSGQLKLLENKNKSIFTGDNSFRFIKNLHDGCIIGASEELLFFRTKNKPEIVKRFSLPGLVDIKDIAIFDSGKSVAILSGLRDSVYIVRGDFKEIQTCFNINKDGKLELFKERQSQCQEVPSNYFQIFYCPGMNNFHKFNRLLLNNEKLNIISDINRDGFIINLSDFGCQSYKLIGAIEYNPDSQYKPDVKLDNFSEKITDFIEC